MALAPGAHLGPYEILSALGAGGMGEVYKARDTRLDRIVAIKTSRTEFSERFEREVRTVASLNHPNICQLYDLGALPEGGSYLMMPALARPQWRTWTSAILAGCVIAGGAFGAARMIRRTPDRLV